MKTDFQKIPCDVLVIGTGAAGCAVAIAAVEKTAKVVITNKGTCQSWITCLRSVEEGKKKDSGNIMF